MMFGLIMITYTNNVYKKQYLTCIITKYISQEAQGDFQKVYNYMLVQISHFLTPPPLYVLF